MANQVAEHLCTFSLAKWSTLARRSFNSPKYWDFSFSALLGKDNTYNDNTKTNYITGDTETASHHAKGATRVKGL